MAYNYLTDISVQLGVPLWLLIIVIAWEIAWKLTAMWKAAKNNSLVWFIVLAVVNTFGILPILYIFGFSKCCKPKKKRKKRKAKNTFKRR